MGIQELADDHGASSAVRGVSFSRVRDWKGYGIVQQCGTCEPLQSPTDVALEMSGSAELCRERPNKDSRNTNYDDSHAKEQDARHPEELVPRHKKRRVSPPNSLHQRVRIALCFTLCAGCKLRKHKAIQAVNFPVLLVISGEL